MIDLEWDYQMALEWVSERLTRNNIGILEEFTNFLKGDVKFHHSGFCYSCEVVVSDPLWK